MDFIRDKILNIGEKELKLDNLGEDVVVEKEQPIQEKEQEIEIEEEVNPAPAAQQEAEEAQLQENKEAEEIKRLLDKIGDAGSQDELSKIDLGEYSEEQRIKDAIEERKKELQKPQVSKQPKKEKIPGKSLLESETSNDQDNLKNRWESSIKKWNDQANEILKGNVQIFSGLNEILKGILEFSLSSSGVADVQKGSDSSDGNANEGGNGNGQ